MQLELEFRFLLYPYQIGYRSQQRLSKKLYLIYNVLFFSLALIARETAPAAAFKDMFHGNSDLSHYGPLASGVPGRKFITYK